MASHQLALVAHCDSTRVVPHGLVARRGGPCSVSARARWDTRGGCKARSAFALPICTRRGRALGKSP